MTVYERVKNFFLNNKVIVAIIFTAICLEFVFDLTAKAMALVPYFDNDKAIPNSPYAEYGGVEFQMVDGKIDTTAVWCEYKGRFVQIEMDFLFTRSNAMAEKFAKVNCVFEETPRIDCKYPTIQANKHIYLSDRVYLTDEANNVKRVSIVFVGDKSNQPRCSLKFEGIIKDDMLQGDLTWKRIDQSKHPLLEFTIRHSISKTLSL